MPHAAALLSLENKELHSWKMSISLGKYTSFLTVLVPVMSALLIRFSLTTVNLVAQSVGLSIINWEQVAHSFIAPAIDPSNNFYATLFADEVKFIQLYTCTLFNTADYRRLCRTYLSLVKVIDMAILTSHGKYMA